MAENKATAKIRFLVDRKNGDKYDFKAGEVYELSKSLCYRWVRRNVASYVDIGSLEDATPPEDGKLVSPQTYMGCDGGTVERTPEPDIVPLEELKPEPEPKSKAVKRAKK